MTKILRRFYIQIAGLIVAVVAILSFAWIGSSVFSVNFDRSSVKTAVGESIGELSSKMPEKPKIIPIHLVTPDPVKAIYMSQCVAGTKNFRDKLVAIADATEINSIVIDIKDYSGFISFKTDDPKLSHAVSDTCRADDMIEFVDLLHKKNIYVIGRITVFQDPHMTKLHPELAVKKFSDGGVWKDYKGLSFIDVGAKEHWDYIVEISKAAHSLGFDELNYDYIRYPSDGNMKDASFTLSVGKSKPEMLEDFFTYLHDQVKPTGAVLSADLFGMTTTNTDDLNIGQVLERALPHFDFVSPMVYPSHYPPTFNGWSDPNKYPYEVVYFSMTSAILKAKALDALIAGSKIAGSNPNYSGNSILKLRPWLQDFDYGGSYDIPEIKAQMKATYDAGLKSWMLWAPSNIYTVGALDK